GRPRYSFPPFCATIDFYPRPPRGGRPGHGCPYFKAVIISTHALREEGDDDRWLGRPRGTHFYPRPPRGGRPMLANLGEMAVLFLPTPSARRATSVYRVPPRASASNFYPRPP